ncbi:MAG: DUF4153 domain-containing protein [Cyclobacteriaceae bacterium]|nr:DUF4153 domain-containing protein [Cyclobacteriaceae bacterium]
MKLPSIQKLLEGLLLVIKRFPLEMVITVIGTVTAMLLIETNYNEDESQLLRIILCCNLGLVLLLSSTLFEEAHGLSTKSRAIAKAIVLLLLIGIYFLLHPIIEEVNGFRFGFLAVGFHLLVSFAPFIRRGSVEGFWEYNKLLFIRILTAALYSTVLFAGLSIAIASTDALFNLNIDGKTYGHLFCLVAGIFNTAFFLAGVPSHWKVLEETQLYPKGLKIFTQFVLIPLATVYLGILLAYELKLIAEWSLPKGIVSSLVLGYAVYGILSILLIYPIRFDEGNRWIRTFSKWFYILLIPLIVLLALAVWKRVDQYGVTESRYIVVVLSLWLTGITIYFLTSRSQHIKLIPVSLCVVALLAVIGPQSASSISQNSQMKRLVNFFEQHDAVENGKLIPISTNKMTGEGADILRFLIARYGAEPLRNYLSVNLDSLTQSADTVKSIYSRKYERIELVRSYLGLNYSYSENHYDFFSANAASGPLQIDDYQFLVKFSAPYTIHDNDAERKKDKLIVEHDSLTYEFDLTPLFQLVERSVTGNNRYVQLSASSLSITDDNKGAKVYLENIYFKQGEDGYSLQSCNGYLLLKVID